VIAEKINKIWLMVTQGRVASLPIIKFTSVSRFLQVWASVLGSQLCLSFSLIMVSFSRLWNNVNIYILLFLTVIPSYCLLSVVFCSCMAWMPTLSLILDVKLVLNCDDFSCDFTSILVEN
jgi:hypothetical protein